MFAAIAWSPFESLGAFREATSASEHIVRAAESGTTPPRIDMVQEWASLLNISPAWLAFGGPYPDVGRGAVCATILQLLPPALLSMMRRFDEILRLGEASGPTVAEWATVVRAWIEYSEADLPLLLAEMTELQKATDEFDAGRTTRYYPGLAVFLSDMADAPDKPTPEEREALQAMQFPAGVRPPADLFRLVWETMRARNKSKG